MGGGNVRKDTAAKVEVKVGSQEETQLESFQGTWGAGVAGGHVIWFIAVWGIVTTSSFPLSPFKKIIPSLGNDLLKIHAWCVEPSLEVGAGPAGDRSLY